ncbi:MAG TPA: MFS transporter [Anaerolineaceae bacterium]|jgi:fucose permease|nr:MFS transporter [Anaerolineaceae bacterium]HOR78011.1 MFS transporter [Anaerolineaceae bacterium]HPK26789.1 MFS transporter [Anaerolineaceae bacterium]
MSQAQHNVYKNSVNARPAGLILLIFVAFIALGMPDGLLGVGWPSIRASFNVPIDALGALLFVSMIGYLTSSFLSGELTRRWGVGRLLIVSCALTGAGLIGYTLVPQWWMMVALGLAAGMGAGGIDSSLNAYVARHYSAGLMQWLHASYGVGITAGPLIMTAALTNFQNWRLGYLLVGTVQIVLAITFWITLPIWQQNNNAPAESPAEPQKEVNLGQTLKRRRVWLSMLLFFFYVGSEVTMGTWVYSLLTEGRGVDPQLAGYFAGSYWFTFTIGRILAGLVTRKINIQSLVKVCIIAAILAGVVLGLNLSTWVNLAAVAVIGFAFAPIFPGLISGTPERVGQQHSNNTIGMQTAAGALGGTALTSLVGVLARTYGLEVVPSAMVAFLACLLAGYIIFERKGAAAG